MEGWWHCRSADGGNGGGAFVAGGAFDDSRRLAEMQCARRIHNKWDAAIEVEPALVPVELRPRFERGRLFEVSLISAMAGVNSSEQGFRRSPTILGWGRHARLGSKAWWRRV